MNEKYIIEVKALHKMQLAELENIAMNLQAGIIVVIAFTSLYSGIDPLHNPERYELWVNDEGCICVKNYIAGELVEYPRHYSVIDAVEVYAVLDKYL